ncbi:MAG: tRNA lysidine(34) synthetase TilS [Actinobacteria bacterium]|nr:tRNA lysidine(34) synthetase TilS [Actinomycetota bacterium]MBW3643543.1 tRNA lysidine(34) synthetase TilS [Actinomycetota bacterium]
MAAVSGGADSSALLVLAVEAGCDVTATHVDHGLRAGSSSEADVVAALAASVGARFLARRAPVAPGPNLEARARRARFSVLPPGAMTGHTADDQAETVVLNLVRGAGLDGMAAMRPGPTKPLLALRRRETAALCAALGIQAVVDPSNDDLARRRNRVRHEVLPLLDRVAERDVAAVLARNAALAGDDVRLLDDLAEALDPSDAHVLAAAPRPLARRAVRRWLVAGGGPPPPAAAVERVLEVAEGRWRATEIGGARRVARRDGRLRVEPMPSASDSCSRWPPNRAAADRS